MNFQVAEAVRHWAQDATVQAAADSARGSIDELLWRRDVRGAAAEFSTASRVRGAQESAAIDGADVAAVDGSPMGRVLAAAQAVTDAAPSLVETWSRSPLQVLAHLHAVAARAHLDAESLGRPRTPDQSPDDPLNLGGAPNSLEAAQRLTLLGDLVTAAQQESALVVAGIVHAELVAARPFAWGSSLVARAGVRLVMADRGVDPSLFSIPEAGMMRNGRPAYVRAVRAYESGDVVQYLAWFCDSVRLGAQAAAAGVPGQP